MLRRNERMRASLPMAGFALNRLLVAASLAGALASFLVLADWMTKARHFAQIDIATAVAAALVTGMVYQANARRFVRFVDRIFLPRRFLTATALDRIRDSLREGRTTSRDRVPAQVADALGVTSVAVFRLAQDGGYVRQAAVGWPAGTAWHLLPGDALTASLAGGATLVTLTGGTSEAIPLPPADARPRLAVTLRRRGCVRGAFLLALDARGAGPDRDTVRGLAAVLAEMLGY